MIVHFVQETVETLRDTLRELQVEYEIQRKSMKDVEDQKNERLKTFNSLR